MTTALLILGALYLLSRSAPIAQTTQRAPATGVVSPSTGTRVTIPGVGSYYNTPGGTAITLDPSFYGRFIPSAQPAPELIAQPVAVPDYQAFDTITYPSDPYYGCADPFAPCFA